ncbi:hypothetical protein RchiOBHm_Chr5g0062601 [Rosa chinensis]|uniref:Uncharacterized protein n=1 Tax=Rosa chinensis TaxID=74649 RepID=A0A2P6QI79_ROSCH|nr:hypothetical protein RchiOBHm_Chr5g0062601 [Rosa chinensis]
MLSTLSKSTELGFTFDLPATGLTGFFLQQLHLGKLNLTSYRM